MANNNRGRGQSAFTPKQWATKLAQFKPEATLVEIAKKLGVTPPAVGYQLKKLDAQEREDVFYKAA